MTMQALEAPRFIRKTQLAPSEYRKNFHQLDHDILLAITSPEADKITPLMSKIYLRLTTAPADYWEREGVLRFEAQWREGKRHKAWSVLCEVLGVASATASKALIWMHEVGVIGYFSGKNGVGIRIFLNRAANSIGARAAQRSKKILPFSPASSFNSPASPDEAAFNDSFAVLEISDPDFNPHAPKIGADKIRVDKISSEHDAATCANSERMNPSVRDETEALRANATSTVSVDEIVRRLKAELEPSLQTVARQAAQREHERTREWLETRGLPKAARVAQREAYNVLRSHGVVSASKDHARTELEVGRSHHTPEAKLISAEEVKDLAEMCIAMLETHGQGIDMTLSEISAEAGGFLLAEDAPRVRALAESMIQQISQNEK
ncbi:MAG: hypothetical protein WCF57_12090 [Pyrinomonadaceae bacterium]